MSIMAVAVLSLTGIDSRPAAIGSPVSSPSHMRTWKSVCRTPSSTTSSATVSAGKPSWSASKLAAKTDWKRSMPSRSLTGVMSRDTAPSYQRTR